MDRTAVAIIVGTALVAALLLSPRTGVSLTTRARMDATPPVRTIWSGVYTKTQADRGARMYLQTCSRCHGVDLSGSLRGTPLRGAPFFDRWNDFRLRWLFENIRFAMPHDFKDFLSADSARDVMTFLLDQNGVPAGPEELSTDMNTLEHILITKPRN